MMRHSRTVTATLLAALAAAAAGGWSEVAAQPRERPARGGGAGARPIPRTPDGRPDLQGVFSFATATPLQRPADLANKAFLTEAEAAAYARQQQDRRSQADTNRRDGSVGGYNQFWYEFGTELTGDRRTSLIIDPPDGRIPPLTPEGAKRADEHRAMLRRPAEGPEDRDVSERCILGYNAGPPMVPGGYNQNVQIVQTRDYLAIHNEMVHNVRIVPLDNRPRLAEHLRPWNGDSRGRWEGDTLVVETRNFKNNVWNQFSQWNWSSDENMRVVERFTRVDADTVMYEFTVDDPTVWTRPWTAQVPLRNTGEQMYEYACHEGNYGMFGILRGARVDEAEGLAGASTPRLR